MKRTHVRVVSIFLCLVLLFSNMGMENIAYASNYIENSEAQNESVDKFVQNNSEKDKSDSSDSTDNSEDNGADSAEDSADSDLNNAENPGDGDSDNAENSADSDLNNAEDSGDRDSDNVENSGDGDSDNAENSGDDDSDNAENSESGGFDNEDSDSEDLPSVDAAEAINETDNDTENTNYSLDLDALERWNSNSVFNGEIENKVAEQVGNGGYDIYSIEVSDKIASVSFSTLSEAVLVVSIYDEDTRQMLASGSVEIAEAMETAQVEIEIDVMPDYFYMKGFIVDSYGLNPLCTAFDSNLYTRSIQEFLAKSAEDFIAENKTVIQFDEEDSDYLVIADEVAYIVCEDGAEEIPAESEEAEEAEAEQIETDELEEAEAEQFATAAYSGISLRKNELVSFDEDTKTFIFANPGFELYSLVSTRKKFIYNYNNEYTLAISPKSVTRNSDGTVTIVAEDNQDISDFFEYARIEAENERANDIDESEITQDPDVEIASEGAGAGGKISYKLTTRKDKENPGVFGADLNISLGVSFSGKYIYTPEERYFEAKLNTEFDVKGSISIKTKKDIVLAKLKYVFGPCVIDVPLSFHFEGELDGYIELKVKGEHGVSCHYDGWRAIKKEDIELEGGIEGKLKAGLQLETSISILSKLLAEAELTVFAGCVLETDILNTSEAGDDSFMHDCKPVCIDGKLSAEASVELSGKIYKLLEGKVSLFNATWFLTDWYLCFDKAHTDNASGAAKFELSKCPHMLYKVVFFVKDTNGLPAANKEVSVKNLTNGTGKTYKTNNRGQIKTYLPNAAYEAEIKYDDGEIETRKFNVFDNARSVLFYRGINAPNIQKIDGGRGFTAILTKGGKLYVWGLNDCGQLGDGTTNNSLQPQLVEGIGTVKDIAVGISHIVAINTNGELYLWGGNSYGQLGDGTTQNRLIPQKIESLSPVKAVAAGDYHTGAITRNGELYMWGNNSSGQIGNGSNENVLTPENIKLNHKVKLVACGEAHSGAVTTMGELYMWGNSENYRLGVSVLNAQEAYNPLYVKKDNITVLSLGGYQSAYVTEDGKLYTWGYLYRSADHGYGYQTMLNNMYRDKATVPYLNPVYSNIKDVICKDDFTIIVSKDGKRGCGGYIYGTIFCPESSRDTWEAAESKGIQLVGAGYDNAYYVTEDAIYVYGDNVYGQHGNTISPDRQWYLFGEAEDGSDGAESNDSILEDGNILQAGESNTLYSIAEVNLDLTSFVPAITVDSDETVVSVEFADLEPNAQYNLYALKKDSAEDAFKDNNLLYIDQMYSNENGVISANIMMKESYYGAYIFAIGNAKSSIEDTEIVVPDCIYTGSELFCAPEVSYNGNKLKEGIDYIVCDHFYGTEPASYSVIIKGIGSFEGEKAVEWNIVTGTSCLSAKKTKIVYECGERLNTDDLTVTYYNPDGIGTVVDDYVTNADKIDMYTPGTKDLAITYNGLTVIVNIIVNESTTVKEPVTIAAAGIMDSVYTGKEISYDRSILVTSKDGVNLTNTVSLTYSYSGVMADGNPYTAYDKIPVNAGEYSLSIAVAQEDENYTGSVEYSFKITKAPINIEALSIMLNTEDTLPETYEYKTEGMLNGDKLLIEPSLTCEAVSMEPGIYTIVPNGADAGMNYEIFYKNGRLVISDDSEVLPDDIPEDGNIPEGLWIAGLKDYKYTGKAIKPEVRVYDYKKLLEAGKDYSISYKNNIKVCDVLPDDASANKKAPCVVVKGKGCYTGTETAAFRIMPVDLDEVTAQDITVAYNKKVQKKVPVLTYNGKKLINKKDFIVSYPELELGIEDAYKAAASYTMVVSAKEGGNFIGTKNISFTITNNTLISKASVKRIPNQTYDGNAKEPELEVYIGKTSLTEGVDYTVEYEENTEVGTAAAILTGIGDYAGTKKAAFKIIGTSLKGAIITGIEDKQYNAAAWEPEITVTVGGRLLTEDTDYEVSYAKNINSGKATVTVKGIKAYTGSIKKTFKINAYDLGNLKDQLNGSITAKYVKGGAKPEVTLLFEGTELRNGVDYTVSYKNNKAVTTSETGKMPSLTIKGRGNFKGSITKDFTIVSKALDDEEAPVTIEVSDTAFVNKPGKYISRPVLIDVDGKKLISGKDYESEIAYTLDDGTVLNSSDILQAGDEVHILVSGKNAYFGTLSAEYRIAEKNFSKARISIMPQSYTGSEILLDENDTSVIKVSIGGETLIPGIDYEIVKDSYTNNIKKGTATVKIAGKGKYGGTKSAKFKITAKKFIWFKSSLLVENR